MTTTHASSTHATSVERGLIHDLRNLFGVVASAKHMLEDGPAGVRRDTLLAAIEDAAQRGGQLTSNLLAPATTNDAPIVFDVSNRVLMMVPMIRAMAGQAAEVRFDLAKARALVKLAPALFEAVIIELVTNASAAFHLPGHILVRVRLQDQSVRITIADDASGMAPEKAKRILADDRPVAVKGTGLGRVRQFVQSCRGSMRLRSRLGRGTVVTLTLPMIPSGTVGETAPRPGRPISPCKERTYIMKTDSQVQHDVIAELEWEPSVDSADIGVAVDKGIVTLSGYVPTYAGKMAAEKAARRVAGVRALAEEIKVRFASDPKTADHEIAQRVLDMFKWNDLIPDSVIQVKVEHGWVTLSGTVDWHFQMDEARKVVGKVNGVLGVSNLVEVRKRPNANEVKNRIVAAIKRQADVDASSVTVRTDGNKVILAGSVKGWHERQIAERAAWAAPGVSRVEDNITLAA